MPRNANQNSSALLQKSVLDLPVLKEKSLLNADPETLASLEKAVLELGKRCSKEGRHQDLVSLVRNVRPLVSRLSKAKASKVMRTLIDYYLELDEGRTSRLEGIELVKECIDWAKKEKRTFMRQALESRLIELLFFTKKFTEALRVSKTLIKELKEIDDKELLLEVYLWESKCFLALDNLQAAKNSLVCSRGISHAIYIAPRTQAHLDLQSGILSAYRLRTKNSLQTAYAYFFEAFEQFDSIDDPMAVTALKYMMLATIMQDKPDEAINILQGRIVMKYIGEETKAMRALAIARRDRSLKAFREAIRDHEASLSKDPVIAKHLEAIEDRMVEEDLCRVIQPYSRIEISEIAKKMEVSEKEVEKRLNQMILDKKVSGIMEFIEEYGLVFCALQEKNFSQMHIDAASTMDSLTRAVAHLYNKAQSLA